MKLALSILAVLLPFVITQGQAPGVPIYLEGRGARTNEELLEQAKKLQDESALLSMTQVAEQSTRRSCDITLPAANSKPLTARERWQRARQAHLRVGAYYLCSKCEHWHLNLAGGYAITAEGAVATCAHVLAPPANFKEGRFIAVNEDDVVLPVTSVLACNRATDSAIIRVKSAKPLTPLPLGFDVSPGDSVWCFSDPSGKRGFFSEGIVSRFVKRPFMRRRELENIPDNKASPPPVPVWLETTTDWAPGSSGSALIDACGNCVGHVSEIQTVLESPLPSRRRQGETTPARQLGTQMIFHQAIGAIEVKALVKKS